MDSLPTKGTNRARTGMGFWADDIIYITDHGALHKALQSYLSEIVIDVDSPGLHSPDQKLGQGLISLNNSNVKEPSALKVHHQSEKHH